jgi:hypothetical protein
MVSIVARRVSRRRSTLLAGIVLCMAHSAAAQQPAPALGSELICGPDHAAQVRRVMIARNPNAAANTARPSETELRFGRGLLIRDFARLRAERAAELPEAIRRIDPVQLRADGDAGRLTGDACAVVQFMSEYYGSSTPASARIYLRADEPALVRATPAPAPAPAATPAETPLPAVSSPPLPPRPRPDRIAALVATDAAPAAAPVLPDAPPAPALAEPVPLADPTPLPASAPAAESAAFSPVPSDGGVRPVSLRLLTEIAAQLEVQPFLSFREERIRAARMSEDEVKHQREAALLATERIVSVLTTLQMVPALRTDVQLLLGRDGRARLEAGIVRTFEHVPDEKQRERVLELWNDLEAQAVEKR